MDRLTLRVKETAEALGISRAKAYELIAAGEIPSVRIGGCVRVPLDALRAWIRQQTDDVDQTEVLARLKGAERPV